MKNEQSSPSGGGSASRRQVALALFEDVATVTGYDEAGNVLAGIESPAEPVREWVRGTYEDYREDAQALTPEDVAE